ncbi:hypothetical protein [Aureliella helgolandensis]|uniref:hypothetical protein n=1 Tax=Aureliella helgolandensis TaxID=2527968 RepID=UPI0011A21CD9|nr:hypothetical protein [Aureliella helgolandensis]
MSAVAVALAFFFLKPLTLGVGRWHIGYFVGPSHRNDSFGKSWSGLSLEERFQFSREASTPPNHAVAAVALAWRTRRVAIKTSNSPFQWLPKLHVSVQSSVSALSHGIEALCDL